MSKSTRRRDRSTRSKKKKKAQPNTTIQTSSPQMTKANREQTHRDPALEGAWISKSTGLILISLLSVLTAIYVGWQVVSQQGWGKGIVWGAIAGASIWGAFYASYYFNRWLRRQ